MKTTPKDFFIHVGSIVTLYVSAISLITLLFQVVNTVFPDVLYAYSDPYSSGIRWAIASLIIVFPLFIFLSWLLEKEYRRTPDKRNLPVKRWLTFFTIFVTGVAIAIDLVVLINSFLGGEITTRFALKVFAVLLVSGAVFGYYLLELRRSLKYQKMFAVISAAAVLLSVVGGFVIMGSPITQRKIRLDNQKVNDLQSIQWQIVNYWQQKRALPQSLSDLENPISGFMVPVDPETDLPYEYTRKTGTAFELCATFNLEGSTDTSRDMSYAYPSSEVKNNNWKHDAGRACFERTIDPELYPPYPAGAQKI